MSRILLLNKPYGVLCQFTDPEGRSTLSDYVEVPGVYAAGRLDRDSEGALILTDDGALQAALTQPRFKFLKRYWVQVEGVPAGPALAALREGVRLKDGLTRPARAHIIEPPPGLWVRSPPIRERRLIPTTWMELGLREGRNRQVRRMTAAVGHPTLRLIRCAVGPWSLGNLPSGSWREVSGVDLRGCSG